MWCASCACIFWEDEDARDVENEVDQRDLHRLPLVPGRGHGRRQAGGQGLEHLALEEVRVDWEPGEEEDVA